MAKQPSKEQAERLKTILKKFPVSVEDKEWDPLIELQSSLKQEKLAPLIKGQIKASLEGKKSPSLLVRLRALWTLTEIEITKKGSATRFWKDHLIKASEWVALQFSVDSSLDEKVRFQLEPEKTNYAYEFSFYLKGCLPEEILKCQDVSKLGSLPWTKTATYLPQHFTWGSSQGPKIYLPYPPTWENAHALLVLPTKGGHDLYPIVHGEVLDVKLNKKPETLAEEDGKLPGGFEGQNVHFWAENLTPLVPHCNQIFNERLYTVLVEYIDELLAKLPTPPIPSLNIDPVTIEAYPHPLFGKDHQIGARRPHRHKTNPLIHAVKPDPEIAQNLVLPNDVDENEIVKIAFLDMACANLLRHVGQIELDSGALTPVRNSFTFPRFAGEDGIKNKLFYHDWHAFKETQKPFSGAWEGLIQAYSSQEMAKRAQLEADKLNKRFKSAKFRWTAMHELVLRGAEILLKGGAFGGATPYHLSWYIAGKYFPDPNSNWVMIGQEFWLLLGTALDLVEETWKSCKKFPEELVAPMAQFTNVMLHWDAVMHSSTPEILKIRQTIGNKTFFRNVLQGSFDNPPQSSDET